MQKYEFDLSYDALTSSVEKARREVAAEATACGGMIVSFVAEGPAGGLPLAVAEVFDWIRFERWMSKRGLEPRECVVGQPRTTIARRVAEFYRLPVSDRREEKR